MGLEGRERVHWGLEDTGSAQKSTEEGGGFLVRLLLLPISGWFGGCGIWNLQLVSNLFQTNANRFWERGKMGINPSGPLGTGERFVDVCPPGLCKGGEI